MFEVSLEIIHIIVQSLALGWIGKAESDLQEAPLRSFRGCVELSAAGQLVHRHNTAGATRGCGKPSQQPDEQMHPNLSAEHRDESQHCWANSVACRLQSVDVRQKRVRNWVKLSSYRDSIAFEHFKKHIRIRLRHFVKWWFPKGQS